MFGFLKNGAFRGLASRASQRLAAEIGSHGFGTETLAFALAHACYPGARYGDNGPLDYIVSHLKRLKPRPCHYQTAWQHVENWLDRGKVSTHEVFMKVWGMDPDRFVATFLEQSGSAGNQPRKDDIRARQHVVLRCQKCGQALRVPSLDKEITITCPKCKHRFAHNG
jgi:hypothetical protein